MDSLGAWIQNTSAPSSHHARRKVLCKNQLAKLCYDKCRLFFRAQLQDFMDTQIWDENNDFHVKGVIWFSKRPREDSCRLVSSSVATLNTACHHDQHIETSKPVRSASRRFDVEHYCHYNGQGNYHMWGRWLSLKSSRDVVCKVESANQLASQLRYLLATPASWLAFAQARH